MDKKDKRKKILKISGLIGLFLLVFGLSYALFTLTLNGTRKVKIKTGKLELQLLDENNQDITDSNNAGYVINLDNQVPVDDETGLGTQAFEFKLKNNGTIDASYTIYLDDIALESGETRLPDSAVRYSLTKNGSSDNPQDLTTIGANPNRKLDEGIIRKDVTNTYTLKVWIDEEAGNEAMDKVFAATLRVVGTQYVAPPVSEYGIKIAETQLTETITATYYQPEESSGYRTNTVKRMSNVEKIDNETTYEGGTLVISGSGEIPDTDLDAGVGIIFFLWDATVEEIMNDVEKYVDEDEKYIFKYNPESVIIEDGITKIGGGSFADIQSITNVELPNTLKTIGESAFSQNQSLTSVILPNGLKTIGSRAFSDTGLSSIDIPNTVTEVGYRAFQDCPALSSVNLSKNLSKIENSTFGGTAIKKLHIPKGVESIELDAFPWENIEELYIPNTTLLSTGFGYPWPFGNDKTVYFENEDTMESFKTFWVYKYSDYPNHYTLIVDSTKFE